MMNSNSTPKIVVGIGLAVVFGVGVSVFTVRAKHESELARNAPAPALAPPSDQAAPSDQSAAGATASAPGGAAQTPIDQTSPASSAPAAAPPIVAPSAVAPAPPAAPTTSTSAKEGTDRHPARTRTGSNTSTTRVASAEGVSNSVTPDAATGAGPAVTSSEPVASDSQITAAVKSEIASAAPGSNVDVTTTNGIVALAGSVPSQDNVDQARQAAERIPGVKHVDTSALTVGNQ